MTDKGGRVTTRGSAVPGEGGPPAWQYQNKRVLVVDDQPEIHEDFVDMLTASVEARASDDMALAFTGERHRTAQAEDAFFPELDLSHAYNGLDACEQIEEAWRARRPFALAFVDVRMSPGIDGIEAIQRIRETDRDVEIVIMTAYSDRSLGDIIRSTTLLHKMLYLRKPFSREEIQQIAVCLVGKWNVERALAARSREITASNKTLEAVLDSSEDAMVMFDVSEPGGCSPTASSNGFRASGRRN